MMKMLKAALAAELGPRLVNGTKAVVEGQKDFWSKKLEARRAE